MKNKVMIKLILPEFDQSFDVFIPVNEVVWKIKRLMIKAVSDLTGIILDIKGNYVLINKDNIKIYGNNDIIIDTDVRNGTEILLISYGGGDNNGNSNFKV